MCFESQCFLFVFILKMGLTGELIVHEIIRICSEHLSTCICNSAM